MEAVHVATKWETAYGYWQTCISYNVEARLLLIETEIDCPIVQLPGLAIWEFVGYDVAWVAGSFYSAIQQELVGESAKSLLHWKNKLNNHKLFSDLNAAYAFLKERQAKMDSDIGIESYGNFYVIRVSCFGGLRYSDCPSSFRALSCTAPV